MANPSTFAVLLDASTCYRLGSINPMQQLSLLVAAKVLELAAIGGTDYRTNLDALLIAGNCPPLSDSDITAVQIATAYANAAAAGATVPTTINLKFAAATCYLHVPGGEYGLKRILLELDRALGRSKAYPQ